MAKTAVQRGAANLVAGTFRYLPGRFTIARMLGPRYSLRCVLFHDISDAASPFTGGLGVTSTVRDFENTLRLLVKHYNPVRLQDVLEEADYRALPPRPLLVTFDDAYASVCQIAAPLCSKFGVPAVFFVNGACLDNGELALDNLICYVADVAGLEAINAAVHATGSAAEVRSLSEVFSHFLPAISLPTRLAFRNELVRLAGINECELAGEANLYLTSQQLRDLSTCGFEIGNHTYTHVHCRCLKPEDFDQEIDRNKQILERASGTKVRSFSVPYGSSADLTGDLAAHLQSSGYGAAFLVESLANRPSADRFHLDRVSVKAQGDSGLFSEIEVLPRLRVIRNWLTAMKPAAGFPASQAVQ